MKTCMMVYRTKTVKKIKIGNVPGQHIECLDGIETSLGYYTPILVGNCTRNKTWVTLTIRTKKGGKSSLREVSHKFNDQLEALYYFQFFVLLEIV